MVAKPIVVGGVLFEALLAVATTLKYKHMNVTKYLPAHPAGSRCLSIMTINHAETALLCEFAQRIGLAELAFNPQGFASITVDACVIDIHRTGDHWLLFSDLGPPVSGEKSYLTLLQANLFWRATLGATLSLTDDHPPHVVMAQALEWRTLDGPRLETALERFVTTVEDWQELLQRPAPCGDDHRVPPSGIRA